MVDDEPLVQRVARRILEKHGYSVLTASDGAEGVELFHQHRDEVSVVLMDIVMPRMGGIDAANRIREISPDARVILSSGYSQEESLSGFGGSKTITFIQKPYSSECLLAKVREMKDR